MEIRIDDDVSIFEDVVDSKIQRLLLDRKNKSAIRWDSYRNMVFKVIGFDNQNLAILVDAMGNEIHISKKALYRVDIRT